MADSDPDPDPETDPDSGEVDADRENDADHGGPPTCGYCGTEMDRTGGTWQCPLRGCPQNPDWTGPD